MEVKCFWSFCIWMLFQFFVAFEFHRLKYRCLEFAMSKWLCVKCILWNRWHRDNNGIQFSSMENYQQNIYLTVIHCGPIQRNPNEPQQQSIFIKYWKTKTKYIYRFVFGFVCNLWYAQPDFHSIIGWPQSAFCCSLAFVYTENGKQNAIVPKTKQLIKLELDIANGCAKKATENERTDPRFTNGFSTLFCWFR